MFGYNIGLANDFGGLRRSFFPCAIGCQRNSAFMFLHVAVHVLFVLFIIIDCSLFMFGRCGQYHLLTYLPGIWAQYGVVGQHSGVPGATVRALFVLHNICAPETVDIGTGWGPTMREI